ncbi:MAG: GAF domain-containing protein, partial [Leptospiraceae bacterium]|nr:GAF domain-containing protein [Leptospiraceae bacterium]
ISQLREKDESLSNLISHLNKAISITKSIEEKEELAKLNSIVAGKAENSAAFTSAYYYLNIAISLLPPNSWNSSYEFTFDLFLRKAQCSYIIGSFDESETLFSEIIKNAKSNLDKGRVYEIKVVQYANQNHLVKAVDTGLEGLKLFGFNLPRSPSLPRVLVEVIFAWKAQGKRKTKDLLNLPEVKDAETLMVARLLNHLTSPSYGTNQNLFALVVVKGVILALKKGVNESSAYMFGLYAALVGSKLLLFKAGEEYGHLAINLSLRFSNLRQRCRSHFAMGTFVYGWTRHVRDSFTYSLEAFRLARETGDNIYSAYSIVEYCDKLMFLGKDLKSTQEEVGKYTHYVVEQIQDRWIGTLMLAMNQSLLNLLGKTNSKETLSDGFFNEEDYTREINQEGEGQMDWYHTNKSKILYLYGDYDKALEMAKKAEEKMVYSFATMLSGEHNFYHSLILCALINKYPGRKRKYLFQIWLNNLFLKIWAGANKENFLHRTLLVDAEVARIKKQYEKAEILYNRAIEEAKKAGYLQNEALANELAGKYYADRDLIKSARSYILDAYSGYERWGAVHKIKIMENDWMGKVGLSLRSGVNSNYMKTITERNTTDISGTSSTSMILDIFSIMKSSQAISEEIKVSSLLEKMLNILIENAGAEKGVFLVNRNNGLFIEAKMDSGSEKIDSGLKIPLEKFEELPISIINYVLRTRENLVIADASVSPLFKMDPFIINKKIKSIFCMPVLYQAKLFGILYLENNLATDAFSESRAEIVNLLSSQISISLNNAILYSDMEEMAKSFSRFVPGQFLEFLGKKNIQEISAGDAMPHKMTILFSDIRDFTNISEKMDVKDNFGFLNSYMKRMEPIIKKNEGFIDKFIG